MLDVRAALPIPPVQVAATLRQMPGDAVTDSLYVQLATCEERRRHATDDAATQRHRVNYYRQRIVELEGLLRDYHIPLPDGEAHTVQEIRYQGDELDEIVVQRCTAHLEQMGQNDWWLGLSRPEGMLHVDITGRKVRVTTRDELNCREVRR